MSAAKKQKIRETNKIRAGAPVCYLCDRSSSRFQPIITQQLWHLFLPNLHMLVSSYTVPYIPNLKETAPAVPEIRVPETRRIFFVFFFFFAPNNKSVRKICSCAPISTKFGAQVALPKPLNPTSPQNLVRFAVKLRKI